MSSLLTKYMDVERYIILKQNGLSRLIVKSEL